jgi:hypothetical protein
MSVLACDWVITASKRITSLYLMEARIGQIEKIGSANRYTYFTIENGKLNRLVWRVVCDLTLDFFSLFDSEKSISTFIDDEFRI